jgi:hypothetical protein
MINTSKSGEGAAAATSQKNQTQKCGEILKATFLLTRPNV